MAIDPTRFPMPGDPDFDPGAFQGPRPGDPGYTPEGDTGQQRENEFRQSIGVPSFVPLTPAQEAERVRLQREQFAPPPDISGYIPQPPREAIFGNDQTFSNVVPRVSGNTPSPRNVSGDRPSVPVWARGLQRSPFARFMQRGGQGQGRIGGFQPEDVAPVETEDPVRRLLESLGLPTLTP